MYRPSRTGLDPRPPKMSKGRQSTPLLNEMTSPLRTGSCQDVGTWAGLLPRLCAHSALDAVGRRRARLDDDVLDALVVGRLKIGQRCAGIRVVVGVIRLDCRDRRTHVGLSGRLVRTIAELEIRRNRNCQQDSDDDDHDKKIDQGETTLSLARAD